MSPAAAYAAALSLLVVTNVCGNLWLPAWTYVPVNLAAGAALFLLARAGGATADDLGLARARLRRGFLVGFSLLGIVAIGVLVAAAVPATRPFFEDERATEAGAGLLLYHVLLRIPLGTALFEEFAFRGVLLGLGRRCWSTRRAVLWSSLLFGLWHLLPAITLADANVQAADIHLALTVTAGVVGTVGAGALFAAIRLYADSLVAAVLTHLATNAFAFAAAWMLFGAA